MAGVSLDGRTELFRAAAEAPRDAGLLPWLRAHITTPGIPKAEIRWSAAASPAGTAELRAALCGRADSKNSLWATRRCHRVTGVSPLRWHRLACCGSKLCRARKPLWASRGTADMVKAWRNPDALDRGAGRCQLSSHARSLMYFALMVCTRYTWRAWIRIDGL